MLCQNAVQGIAETVQTGRGSCPLRLRLDRLPEALQTERLVHELDVRRGGGGGAEHDAAVREQPGRTCPRGLRGG